MGSLHVGGEDRATDFAGREPCGVDTVHRELGVGAGDLLGGVLREDVPAGDRFVPVSEAPPALVLRADQVVGGGLRHFGGQLDVDASTECAVVGEASGEVALHDHWIAGDEMAPDLIDCGQ